MPDKEAAKMLLKDAFFSSLKDESKGEKYFLILIITADRRKATRVPPRKVWKNP